MPFVILVTLIVVLLSAFPTLWIKFQINRFSKYKDYIPGTGGEFAQHLVEKLKLVEVQVLPGEVDGYSPSEKTVYLSTRHYSGQSVAAVAIAAHEVGHAIQHDNNENLFNLRTRYQPFATVCQKIAVLIIAMLPILVFLIKAPVAILFFSLISVFFFLVAVVVQLISLPVELDASFKKALPIIEEGGYLGQSDLPGARKVLRAAALTYVAGSLLKMINVYTWMRILKR